MPPGPSLDAYRRYIESVRVVRLADVFGTPSSRTIVINEGRAAGVVAGLAALVLLGSCATLMALVLVHYERRRRELSVRLALGASRLRLTAQLGTEFAWLAAAGTAGALVVAIAGLRVLPTLSLPGGVDLGRLDLSLDWRVLGAAIGTTTLTLATAGLVPLLRFTRRDIAGEIVAVRSTTPASSQQLRQSLLALHVAATIVVLVSAGSSFAPSSTASRPGRVSTSTGPYPFDCASRRFGLRLPTAIPRPWRPSARGRSGSPTVCGRCRASPSWHSGGCPSDSSG
jgi:hypothetical protein